MGLSKQELNDLLWRRGDLSHILKPWQLKVKKRIWEQEEFTYVVCCSRQIGKSFLAAALSVERCLQVPRCQVKYAAQTKDAVRKIVIPNMETILSFCPEDLKPRWFKHEGMYRFPNGSEIHIAGAESGAAERLRGAYCDFFVVDEAGFIDENNNGEALDNLILDVALPMFKTRLRNKPRILIASTPAKSAAHVFNSEYCVSAQLEKRYTHLSIYDADTPAEDIERFKKAAGGEESATWQREYLARVVVDDSVAVIPEFAHKGQAVVGSVPRPAHYECYVGADFGYSDLTAVLFAYYHFELAKIVVEDELIFQATNSGEISKRIKAKERELWGGREPTLRVADHTSMGIADLNRDFGIWFRKPRKDDKEAAINALRLAVQREQIIIHPKCENTILHLKGAVWNSGRTDFARSGRMGHFDCVDALIYLVRHVNRQSNPTPLYEGISHETHMIFEEAQETNTTQELKKLFRRGRRR